MAETQDSTDWRKLREFVAVDLTKSFVLSWNFESEALLIDIDLCLTPEHPFYEKPRPAEKACIRPAVIEFPYCESISSERIAQESGPLAATGEIGLGAIEGFRRLNDGHYEISGDFGAVHIGAERPILRLKRA